MKNNDCLKKNLIYELTCTVCKEKYIGETQRELHTRVKEHNFATQTGRANSAMREHYEKQHTDIPPVPFTAKILETANDFIDRKLKEAKWIQKLKPSINRDSGWQM